MRMFLIFTSLYCFLGSLNLLDRLADRSFYLQSFCSGFVEQVTSYPALASAFVCGTPIDELAQKEVFLQTGLIHLMVVSGSHLIFVTHLFSVLLIHQRHDRRVEFVLICILISYSFITGFQAPVVRSLFGILILKLSHYFRWNWDSHRVQVIAGLSILSVNPAWISSFSFFLSWFAASGLQWGTLFLKSPSNSKKNWFHVFIPHALTSLLIQFLISLLTQTFSWLSFGTNLIISPLIGILLFPLLLAAMIFPPLGQIADLFWRELLQFLSWLLEVFPQDLMAFTFEPNWLLLATVIGIQFFLRKRRYENSFQ